MPEPYYQTPDGLALYHGDCRAVLASLEPESVDVCVTSPPYWGLRDYGIDGQIGLERTVEEYIATLVDVFAAVRRVLKPTGTVWCNLGDSYNGSGHGGNVGRESVLGLAHPPAERQGFTDRRTNAPGLKPKDLCLIPYRFAIAAQADGWWVRSAITWAKKACMPESVTDRPTCATEMIWLLAKSERYYFDQDAVKEKGPGSHSRGLNPKVAPDPAHKPGDFKLTRLPHFVDDPNGRNLRNFWLLGPEPLREAHYAAFPTEIPRRAILAGTSEKGNCPKCGKPWERQVEKTRPDLSQFAHRRTYKNDPGVMRSDGEYAAGRLSGQEWNRLSHTETLGWAPTCECAESETVPAVVLDPFVGSGTTLLVARQLGRQGVGIDASETYLRDIAIPRLEGQPMALPLEVGANA